MRRKLRSPENLTRCGAGGAVRDLERVHEVVLARKVGEEVCVCKAYEYSIIMCMYVCMRVCARVLAS